MNLLLLFVALVGHAFLWIGLVNRLHALGIRRKTVKYITLVCFFCTVLIPLGIGWHYVSGPKLLAAAPWGIIDVYLILCWAIVPVTLLRLVYLRCFCRVPLVVRFHGIRRAEINPASAASNPTECRHHLLTRIPLNEILQLDVSQWMLDVPRLPPALDGLSIVHLSDLHFTGRVGKAYFREVVRVSNQLQPDLVCVTGDIIDRTECLDWIPDTLGRLTARHGVYCILGNHDLLVDDTDRLRHTLRQSGLVDLGGRSLRIEIDGTPVVLTGNERPWFRPVGCVLAHTRKLRENAARACKHAPYDGDLRIVLAHSPDQFAWARRQNADLMLAGHTHGGQIRIPPLGAIFSPTLRGVRYISGVFYVPPTILHVSRGLSGDVPVRWNSRPEIAHLRLAARVSSQDCS